VKVAGIFRGFPGLGRVVGGTELVSIFRDHGSDVMIFTYMQGAEYVTGLGYQQEDSVTSHDISSIGIIPVGKYGESIFQQLYKFNPDVILVDGEPLMLTAIKACMPEVKVVALLNPCDVSNQSNQKSSQEFFLQSFRQADLAIVHGLKQVRKPTSFNEYVSINTILRRQVMDLKCNTPGDTVSCILGGGSVHVTTEFQNSTIEIASLCLEIAKILPRFRVNIFCGDRLTFNKLSQLKLLPNVTLYEKITDCTEYYSDSRFVVARAGRNVSSELLYLGIPGIVIPTNGSHRSTEQKENADILNALSNKRIASIDVDIPRNILSDIVSSFLASDMNSATMWEPGNSEAVLSIEKLLD